jgi:hypothetical protein
MFYRFSGFVFAPFVYLTITLWNTHYRSWVGTCIFLTPYLLQSGLNWTLVKMFSLKLLIGPWTNSVNYGQHLNNNEISLSVVGHECNPSYLWGRNQEDWDSRSAWAKS